MSATSEPGNAPLARAMAALGAACWRHRWIVILAWIVATAVATTTVARLPERLLSGSGEIDGSMSSQAHEILQREFPALDSQALLFVFKAPSLTPREAAQIRLSAEQRFAALPAVESIGGLQDVFGDNDGKPIHQRVLVLRLGGDGMLAAEQQVPKLRAAIAPVMTAARTEFPRLEWAITGPAALTHDVNKFSTRDSGRAELRALPITLAVLLLAFGSIAAALMPMVMAIAVRTVALGLLFIIAGTVEVSNLVVGVVTMLSIALGIDYSLFLIDRLRSYQRHLSPSAAMERAFAEAGPALLFSGMTVAIGMSGLLLTPLMQMRSIGLGGLMAVLISLAAALTLVPAVRALIPDPVFEWRPFPGDRAERRRRRWRTWADRVAARPAAAGLASLAVILLIAAPAAQIRFGIPDERFLPPKLEYMRGLDLLADAGLKGLAAPITVIVTDTDGGPAVTTERVAALSDFVAALERDPSTGAIIAPDFLAASRPMPFPVPQNSALVSSDESRFAVRIIPDGAATIDRLQAFADRIARSPPAPGLSVMVDGQAQYYNDFDRSVVDSYPAVIVLVLGLSAITLLIMFRAPLVAAKALALNLLSVAAGFGAVVWVFQLGHGAELFGVAGGVGAIPATVPLIVFAILFGVSMDYEIFLLARVRDHYLQSRDPRSSIADGLADTGAVITSAALVMIGVFGAFAFAELIVVQMLGLGLAVAVLVDAVLIRSLLGPALMQLAGHWNWWPLALPEPMPAQSPGDR